MALSLSLSTIYVYECNKDLATVILNMDMDGNGGNFILRDFIT